MLQVAYLKTWHHLRGARQAQDLGGLTQLTVIHHRFHYYYYLFSLFYSVCFYTYFITISLLCSTLCFYCLNASYICKQCCHLFCSWLEIKIKTRLVWHITGLNGCCRHLFNHNLALWPYLRMITPLTVYCKWRDYSGDHITPYENHIIHYVTVQMSVKQSRSKFEFAFIVRGLPWS